MTIKISKIRTILFDLDGTLLNSARYARVIQEKLFRNNLGRELTPAENQRFRGMATRDILGYIDPERVDDLLDECMRLAKTFLHEATLFPGIAHVLNELSEIGFFMAVVTSQSAPEVRMMRTHLALNQWIKLWLSADDVDRPKPDPEPINTALEMIGGKASETIMVGDTLNDLEAGNRAGVITGAALWGVNNTIELLNYTPDYIFNKPEDILTLIPHYR